MYNILYYIVCILHSYDMDMVGCKGVIDYTTEDDTRALWKPLLL